MIKPLPNKKELMLSSEIKLCNIQLRCLEARTGELMLLKYAVDKELEARGYPCQQ